MAARDVYMFVDPDADGITVEMLMEHLQNHHPKERVVVATGEVTAPFLPVRSIANSNARGLVMEL